MCPPRRHSHRDRLVSGAGVSAIAVIRLEGHDGEALTFGGADGLDGEACRSSHDDIVAVIRLTGRSERLHEPVHARHEAMPFPVGFALAALTSASPASHRLDDVCDVSDASGVPKDRMAEEQPKDCLRGRRDRPFQSRDQPDWDSGSTAHDGDLYGDAACTSSRWHRLHCAARTCDIRRPVPCLNHPKRSYTSWRPCPPLEGCVARPRLKRGRAPNLGSVFLS